MSNDLQTRQQHPAVVFRRRIESVAASQLAEAAETPEGRRLLAAFGSAFASAARQARDPSAFYNADPASVAAAAAMSLQTGLKPGGAMPEVWLIPRGREIQWSISHRGLMRLARQAGWAVRAVVVHIQDIENVEIVDGNVTIGGQDPTLYVERLDDIGGVAVFATGPDGATVSTWTPAGKLRKVAKMGGPSWKSWPAEMAAKSAIKDAFSRGYIPVESEEIGAALSADVASSAPQQTRADVLDIPGLEPEPAQIEQQTPEQPDGGEWSE